MKSMVWRQSQNWCKRHPIWAAVIIFGVFNAIFLSTVFAMDARHVRTDAVRLIYGATVAAGCFITSYRLSKLEQHRKGHPDLVCPHSVCQSKPHTSAYSDCWKREVSEGGSATCFQSCAATIGGR